MLGFEEVEAWAMTSAEARRSGAVELALDALFRLQVEIDRHGGSITPVGRGLTEF